MNKRTGTARIIEHAGKRMSVSAWSRHTGIPRKAICERLNSLNWPISEALSKPAVSTHKGAKRGEGYLRNGYKTFSKAGRILSEHRLVVERVIGRPLAEAHVVHHVNHLRSDNRPSNLVLCPDEAYHRLLHKRERALESCGNANWEKCRYCHVYDDQERMNKSGNRVYHAACSRARAKQLRKSK